MRRPCKFKVTDVTRATKAVLAAGVHIGRVEIDPATGKIIIVTMAEGGSGAEKTADLDRWIAKDARQT